jgi:hypothetical protein
MPKDTPKEAKSKKEAKPITIDIYEIMDNIKGGFSVAKLTSKMIVGQVIKIGDKSITITNDSIKCLKENSKKIGENKGLANAVLIFNAAGYYAAIPLLFSIVPILGSLTAVAAATGLGTITAASIVVAGKSKEKIEKHFPPTKKPKIDNNKNK